VVTWKSVETVVTFLKVVGGGSALLELESRQVLRSVRGDINRVINAESANLGRAVAASARQLEAIALLESDGRLAEQPYQVRLVADARREEPESTFSELADRLGLHRSAIQRAVERIERLALHPDEGVGKRTRGARLH
jgi:DNA-binding protein WhiA